MRQKNLHVLISEAEHRDLFTKVSGEDFSVSQLVRKWIRAFLAGELQ